ncbi:uncharacterized protein LOC114532342 [Dendronephthya gigantea]|uniref:uncharacterized protein LOC114532342 n=1 Tax=Dendronephthya gigantea TaxID=151771 RepID=UPI00106D7897|nr:uncharacterized protein LOC114532342 [Dendronephthya gigantea]
MTSSSNATQTFWTKDIKVAREAYSTIKGDQAQDFLKEWRKVQDNTKEGPRDSVLEDEELLDIIEEVENAEEVQNVVRRAPRGPQDMHKTSRNLRRLVSRDDVDENIAEKQEMNLQHILRNLQTYYTQQSKEKTRQPHVETIFSKPQKPSPKPKKSIREFHVVETENPHHTSVVRVESFDESSNKYSVKTESGV